MKTSPTTDLSRLCVHTATTKPWKIEEAAKNYARTGVSGISVWQDSLEGRNAGKTGRMLRECGLKIVSYVRGGFFPATEAGDRLKAIGDNRKMIDEAAELGAPLLVLVCGAVPGQSLELSRRQIEDGLAAVLPHAEKSDILLGIEPLHPMYADSRSAINTLKQANDTAERFESRHLGVVIDVYHLWWDPDLQEQIARCGQNGNLLAFHICDWKTPTEDFLLDRGLMGEGCIDIKQIRRWVESAGFHGFHEVEIFSQRYWEMDQKIFLDQIVEAYSRHV
ncbi:MAG: xylose isomerase [Deltaproteobacteria bacterium SG8_13]|nr:MAG: xylose isomerase [Deltaproteobacteria bacterium SG8_13]